MNFNKFQFISVFIILVSISILLFDMVSAQKLTVPDDLIGERTLYLVPQASGPTPCKEGQIYCGTDNLVYYCDENLTWKPIISGSLQDTTVATKIVAAKDSLDSYEDPQGSGNWKNDKADYTCNGIDDQEQINLAIIDLPGNGGAVYLLEGTYNISDVTFFGMTTKGIVVDKNNISLIGTGKGTVLKAVKNIYVISASNVRGVLISQLMIDSDKIGSGISFNTVNYSKIHTIFVKNALEYTIYLNSCLHNTISGNNFQCYTSLGGFNIYLVSSNYNTISGNYFWETSGMPQGTNIRLNSSFHNTISGNNFQGSDCGAALNSSLHNTISGNNFQGKTGIQTDYSEQNTIQGNNFQNGAFGIKISNLSNYYNTISGNNFQSGNVGMEISSSNNIVTGNSIYAKNGIDITLDNNLASSNRIYISDVSGFGIRVIGTGHYLVGNLIDGPDMFNPAKRIIDGGRMIKYMQKEKVNLERKELDYASALRNAATVRNKLRFGGQDKFGVFTPGPMSYIPIVGVDSPYVELGIYDGIAIEDGKNIGDLIILEGTQLPPGYGTSYPVRIPNGKNTKLGAAYRTVGFEDTLTLIWTGPTSSGGSGWVEIGYADN